MSVRTEDWQTGTERDEAISVRVVRRVADRLDAEPTELSPLYEAIDPDFLDEITEWAPVRVGFTYCDREVTVRCDEAQTITVRVGDAT